MSESIHDSKYNILEIIFNTNWFYTFLSVIWQCCFWNLQYTHSQCLLLDYIISLNLCSGTMLKQQFQQNNVNWHFLLWHCRESRILFSLVLKGCSWYFSILWYCIQYKCVLFLALLHLYLFEGSVCSWQGLSNGRSGLGQEIQEDLLELPSLSNQDGFLFHQRRHQHLLELNKAQTPCTRGQRCVSCKNVCILL